MFEYECICMFEKRGAKYHHPMCKLFNLRKEMERINNTGIAKHWREVEEIERLENALSRLKSST